MPALCQLAGQAPLHRLPCRRCGVDGGSDDAVHCTVIERACLLAERSDLGLDGAHTHVQLARDLGIAEPCRHELGDAGLRQERLAADERP